MRKQGDKLVHKLLEDTLLEKAPEGMINRIMSHVALHPVRRTSVTPVEAKPFVVILPGIIVALLGLAFVIKPQSLFSFSIDQYINLNINPIWIAPISVFALAVWAGIFLRKYWEPLIKGE